MKYSLLGHPSHDFESEQRRILGPATGLIAPPARPRACRIAHLGAPRRVRLRIWARWVMSPKAPSGSLRGSLWRKLRGSLLRRLAADRVGVISARWELCRYITGVISL